jgi:hypothetical protein
MNDKTFFLIMMYVITLLIPLIPAITLYKLFPKDKITVKGKLTGFTINATGGFAAYIATVLLGFYMLNKFPEFINSTFNNNITARANLVFQDIDGKKTVAPSYEDLEKMIISFDPKIQRVSSSEINLELPGGFDGQLIVTLKGYETYVSKLNKDSMKNNIMILSDVILKKVPEYKPAEVALQSSSIQLNP